MTPDEYEIYYRTEERIGMMCGDGFPDDWIREFARADVERFGREMGIQEREEME